jgi:sugar lactone lactonase YvrE
MNFKPDLLYRADCILGESPLWDAANNCWLWVDIEGRKMFRYACADSVAVVHAFSQRVSLIVHGRDGNLIVGTETGIGRYDPAERLLVPIADLGAGWDNMRCNDGICDSEGRLWVGTMALDYQQGAGTVYSVAENRVSARIERVSISNGMAWAPDNSRLYYTDSPTGNIVSYLFDSGTGEIIFEKVSVHIPESMGMPDGMAMDEEGILWVAIWGGYMVGGFDVQTGKLIRSIELDVPNVTSCAFGGENMDLLIITTARSYAAGLKEKDEHSGNVFIAGMKVKGMPAYSCRL